MGNIRDGARRVSRTVAMVSVALAAVVAVGACSSGGDDDSTSKDRRPPAVNVAKTMGTGSARVETVTAITFADQPKPREITGQGLYDFVARRGMAIQRVEPTPVDVVFDNDRVFTRQPITINGRRPWLPLSRSTLEPPTGGSVGAADPDRPLSFLAQGEQHLKIVGREAANGAAATHWAGTVTLRRSGATESAAVVAARRGFVSVPFQVWVDAQGRIVRLEYTLDFARMKAAEAQPSVRYLINFSGYGEPADVTVPPEDALNPTVTEVRP